MTITNTKTHYGLVAIIFHWTIAILVITNIVIGLYMASLPEVGFNMKKITLIFTHKEIGIGVLFLVALRLMWRLINTLPTFPSSLPAWQKIAASAVHWSLYGFLFAMPITGWLMSSAAGLPISFAKIFDLPNLISMNQNLIPFYQSVHKWIGYALIATLCLHISAALRHHFIFKDTILIRMLKWW